MGFSLRRALAGAVAGGAGAVVELADNALKSAARDRELQMQFDRQKELMAIQEENAANRAQRTYELKDKRDTDKAARFGTFLSQTSAELKKEGIKPESAQGQARLASALTSGGYPAEGDKFFDNSIKLQQISSNEELRRAEQGIRLEMARSRRSGTADNSSTKAAEKQLADTIDGFAFKVKDRDGKFVDDDRALDEVRRLVDKGRRSGRSVEDINSSLLNFKPVFNAERSKNPSAAGDDIFRSAWTSIQAPKEKPSQGILSQALPVISQAPAQKKVTPGIFSGFGGSGNRPPLDTSSLGYSDADPMRD